MATWPARSRADPQSEVRKYIGVSNRSAADTGSGRLSATPKTAATTSMLATIRNSASPA